MMNVHKNTVESEKRQILYKVTFEKMMRGSSPNGNCSTCRVCLKTKTDDMFCVYDKYSQEYNEPIFCMIMYCASVIISKEDGLPDAVCAPCKLRLETAYLFKRDCEQSDAKLRMKTESEYNFKQESFVTDNLDTTNNSNVSNVKLETDTKTEMFHYGNVDSEVEDPLDPMQRNLFPDGGSGEQAFGSEENYLKVETILLEDPDTNDWPVNDKSKDGSEINEEDDSRNVKSIDEIRHRRTICYDCARIFYSRAEYEAHKIEHALVKYVCDVDNCKMQFTCYIKYSLHQKDDHLIKKYFKCKQCQLSFGNKRTFDRHYYDHHADLPYGCLKCTKMFSEQWALDLHMKKHEKEYKCEYCEKIFSTSFRLTSHTRLHTQEKPFECLDCGKNWTDKSSLNKHLNCHHKEMNNTKKGKQHLCSYCGQTFDRLSHLTIHVRKHTDVRPFSCTYCDHRCRTKQHLLSHIRTHTGDRPYKCSYCAKSFGDKSYLTVHERFHSGERPYICSTCAKGFTNSKDLKVHERIHSGVKMYTCNTCNHSFTTLHYYRIHTKRHLNTSS